MKKLILIIILSPSLLWAAKFHCNGSTRKIDNKLYHVNGKTFKTGDQFYHSNGKLIKSGSFIYYPNGKFFKDRHVYHHANGRKIFDRKNVRYSNGRYLKRGEDCFYQNGRKMEVCPSEFTFREKTKRSIVSLVTVDLMNNKVIDFENRYVGKFVEENYSIGLNEEPEVKLKTLCR